MADILIAMDVSSSITPEEFEKRKIFLGKFVASFPVNENQARFALFHYNHNINIDFTFNNPVFHDVSAIQKAITQVPLLGGSTLTQKALKTAFELFYYVAPHGARQNSRKVLVIVTDGYTYGGTTTLRLPTLELELFGVQVVPVGIGKRLNIEGLRTMSTNAITLDNILNKTDAELLEYLEILTNAACKNQN